MRVFRNPGFKPHPVTDRSPPLAERFRYPFGDGESGHAPGFEHEYASREGRKEKRGTAVDFPAAVSAVNTAILDGDFLRVSAIDERCAVMGSSAMFGKFSLCIQFRDFRNEASRPLFVAERFGAPEGFFQIAQPVLVVDSRKAERQGIAFENAVLQKGSRFRVFFFGSEREGTDQCRPSLRSFDCGIEAKKQPRKAHAIDQIMLAYPEQISAVAGFKPGKPGFRRLASRKIVLPDDAEHRSFDRLQPA